MANPLFIITDGTTTVDLLSKSKGYHINDWTPQIPDIKDGGVFQSSPFVDGRRLTHRRFLNAIETLDLKLNSGGQDSAIQMLQDLRRLLEKATTYWSVDWQGEPVWIEARGSLETNTRYAVIVDYRALSDDNPYAQPFFDCNSVVDEFSLVLERCHWQDKPPGQGTCVQVSSQQAWDIGEPNLVLNPGFETAGGGGADEFANWTETTAGTAMVDTDTTDFYEGAKSCWLISDNLNNGSSVGQAITVVAGAIYHFSFWYMADQGGGAAGTDAQYSIYNNTNPSYIVDPVNLSVASEWTHVSFDFTVPLGCISINIDLYGIIPDFTVGLTNFDYVSLTRIIEPTDPGRSATCNANEVFLANKWDFAQLTHIFIYDADGSDGYTYSPNLMETALPWGLLPTNPAANDAIYFGIDVSPTNYGPFCSLVFDLAAAAVRVTTITWQYWNGNTLAWTALDIQDNTEASTVAFTNTGVRSVHWKIPANWWSYTVNGVAAHWIRALVSVVGVVPTPPVQQNRMIYTVTNPYMDIDHAQVGGDIPALASLRLKQVSDHGGTPQPDLSAFEAYISLRSTDRGQYFYQFFNLCDTQNVPGITCVAGSATTMVSRKEAPTGRAARFNPAGVDTMETRAYFGIDETISDQFLGEFHVFMRCYQDGGTDQDFACRLVIKVGETVVYTSDDMVVFKTTDANLPMSIDFGVVDIGKLAKRFAQGVAVSYMTFSVMVDNDSVGADGDLYLYDLVFVPTDEFCVHLITYTDELEHSSSPYTEVEVLNLNSLSVPAEEMLAYTSRDADEYMIAEWQKVNVGPFILQANANQRIFMYLISTNSNANYKESCPCIVLSVKTLQKLQRYLSMRGIR